MAAARWVAPESFATNVFAVCHQPHQLTDVRPPDHIQKTAAWRDAVSCDCFKRRHHLLPGIPVPGFPTSTHQTPRSSSAAPHRRIGQAATASQNRTPLRVRGLPDGTDESQPSLRSKASADCRCAFGPQDVGRQRPIRHAQLVYEVLIVRALMHFTARTTRRLRQKHAPEVAPIAPPFGIRACLTIQAE